MKVANTSMWTVFPFSHIIVTNINLLLNNDVNHWDNSYKDIGILDSKLTWRTHIAELRAPEIPSTLYLPITVVYLEEISCICTRQSKGRLWRTVAQSGVLPLIVNFWDFGVCQNKTLRYVIKAPGYISNGMIHRDLKVRPICDEIKKFATKFWRGYSLCL